MCLHSCLKPRFFASVFECLQQVWKVPAEGYVATREICQDVVVGRQLTDGDVGCELVVELDRGEHGVKLSGQVVGEKARSVFAGWLKCGVVR